MKEDFTRFKLININVVANDFQLILAEIVKKRKLGKKVMDDLIYLAFMNRLQPIAPCSTRLAMERDLI